MADYSRYKTETLQKMQNAAFTEYYKAAIKPCGDGRNFSKSPEAKKLTRLTNRYLVICAELEKRIAAADNKCNSCVHNIGADVMDCECGYAGVTKVMDEGRIVVSCGDYRQKGELHVSQSKNQWESLFDRFLNTIEFRLVKYPDGWGLIDKQGGNFGGIESDRFCDAAAVIDRLDVYIEDYFVDDIQEDMGERVTGDWSELVSKARAAMAPEELEYHRFDLDVLDMICNHPHEINLENCCFTEEKQEVQHYG